MFFIDIENERIKIEDENDIEYFIANSINQSTP